MPIPPAAAGAAHRYPFDVVVVGGGIAGLSAALSATEAGARVVLVEKAPMPERGGNTRFADAQMRFPHEPDEFGARAYIADEMFDDLMRISGGRANESLIRTSATAPPTPSSGSLPSASSGRKATRTPPATVACPAPAGRASSTSSTAASKA